MIQSVKDFDVQQKSIFSPLAEKETRKRAIAILTHSHTMTPFDAPGKQAFWKYCGKRRNCSKWAISPFPTVFSTCLDNFLPFSSSLKLWPANSFSLEECKICRLVILEIVTPEHTSVTCEWTLEVLTFIYRYTWQRNAEKFNPSGNDDRIVQLPNQGTIVFNSPEDKDEGIFQCFADNGYGISASVKINFREAKLARFSYEDVQVRNIIW